MSTTHQPTVHVVLTTHWDREWVQSFEQYRFRLGELMDRACDILERESGLCFVTDGQTVMLEDYLELRPEQASRVRALVAAGQMVVGPWYVLADQFLESDEAAVRNLLIGRALAESLGGKPMAEGYVPDSFGSIATLPMILNGFGIRCANAGRGAPKREHDGPLFHWTWKDGSRVLTLALGYANALSLAYPEIWHNPDFHPADPALAAEWATRWLAKNGDHFSGAQVYASVGIDHMELRPGMTEVLAAASKATGARWTSSTPERYLNSVAAEAGTLPVVEGELRGDLERLEVLRLAAGGEPVRHVVRRAWKHLLVNHAHDSICACSLDRVMDDIHGRMRQVAELAEIASERWLQDLVPQTPPAADASAGVVLLNPLPGRGLMAFDHLVRVPGLLLPGELQLRDSRGETVGCATVVAQHQADLETRYATNADLLAVRSKAPAFGNKPEECYTLLRISGGLAAGDAAGAIPLRVVHSPRWQPPMLAANDRSLENDLVRLDVAADGRLTLCDLRQNIRWDGLGWFEDLADAGNSYDFEPLPGDVPIRSYETARVETRVLGRDPWVASLCVTTRLCLPAKLTGSSSLLPRERQSYGRRSVETVELTLESTCTLRAGLPWVEITTRFANLADHHRLRVAFSSAERPALASGGHFAILERGWSDPADRFPCRPMLDWVQRGDGLAIVGEGLYEFEPRRQGDGGELLLTLLRSCDSVGPAAGMNFHLEHSRALGEQEARYWLAPAASPLEAARLAASILVPSLAVGIRGDAVARIPARLCAASNPRVRVTAIKRAERGGGTIVRVVNLGGEPEDPGLAWGLPHGKVRVVGLDEEPRDLPATVPPWGSLTICFDDAKHPGQGASPCHPLK